MAIPKYIQKLDKMDTFLEKYKSSIFLNEEIENLIL